MKPTKTIIDAVTALAEAFGRNGTDALIGAYAIGLAGLQDSEIAAATAAGLRSPRAFMPTPGQLRELAVTQGRGYEGVAQEAFLVADRAALRFRNRRLNFADPLVNATVRQLGGLGKIPRPGTQEATFYRKEFISTYVSMCAATLTTGQCQPLPALVDHEGARPAESFDVPCEYLGARHAALIGGERPKQLTP